MALLLQDTQWLAEAEPLMRRALAIFENTFPPDYPVVVAVRSNLTALLQASALSAFPTDPAP